MEELDLVAGEAKRPAEGPGRVTHPLGPIPRGVQREPDGGGVRIDAEARRGCAGSVRVEDEGLRPAKRWDVDGAVLACVRLVALEVVVLEGVEDLREGGLDICGETLHGNLRPATPPIVRPNYLLPGERLCRVPLHCNDFASRPMRHPGHRYHRS